MKLQPPPLERLAQRGERPPDKLHRELRPSVPSDSRSTAPAKGDQRSFKCNAVRVRDGGGKVVSCHADGRVRFYDVASGAQERCITATDTSAALCFDTCGEWLIVGCSDRTLRVHSEKTGRMKHRLVGHGGLVQATVTALDGSAVYSGGADRCIKSWDLKASGRCVHTYRCQSTVTALCSSSDDVVLSSHMDGCVRFWDTRTRCSGQNPLMVSPSASKVVSLSMRPGAAHSLAALLENGRVSILDLRVPTVLRELASESGGRAAGGLAWSPSGNTILAGISSAVWMWDAESGEAMAPVEHPGLSATCLAWNESIVAVGLDDGVVRILA